MDENEKKIRIIDRVLDELNQLSVTGIGNCGHLYAAASDLERLRFLLSLREVAEDTEESEDEQA